MAARSEIPGPGRCRLRDLARCLGFVGLTFAAAAAAAAASAPASPGVEVTVNGQRRIVVNPASIQGAPQEAHSYHDLGPASGQTVTRAGASVRSLLAGAGVDPAQVSLLAVARPRGGFAYLFRADLANPNDFADGPALVSIDGGSTRFFRPQRNPGDQNAADDIATPDGQRLAMSVYTGRLLRLTATHSPARPAAGRPVRFSAIASCCSLPGENLTFTWNFGDNSQSMSGAAAVSHAFAASGTYPSAVALTGSRGSVALPVQTNVVVGSLRRSGGRGAGGTGGPKTPASGPSRGPSHGGAARNGSGGGSGGTNPPNVSRSSRGAPSPPSPAAATSVLTPRPSNRSSGRHQSDPTGGALVPVNGVVIAGPGTQLASVPSGTPEPAGAQASARAGTPATTGMTLPLGILAAGAVVGAGALRERRRPRGRPA